MKKNWNGNSELAKKRSKSIDRKTGAAPPAYAGDYVAPVSAAPIAEPEAPIVSEVPASPVPKINPHDAARWLRVKLELAKRQCEALRIYEPMPLQDSFHKSRAAERIFRGGNRSGKTTTCAVEASMILSGCHPHLKYPQKNGRLYIVCFDEKQIGEVIYPKLFKAGAFRMIRDEVTKKWRVYKPWHDAHRVKESKPAPPLIPGRMVKGGLKGIAWRMKKNNVFTKFTMVNGWECCAYASGAKPPQGMDVDVVWFDEEIEDANWYPEMSARLVDRFEDSDDRVSGRFMWSATPQAGTEQLLKLHEEAGLERLKSAPRVEEFFHTMDDNIYMEQYKKDVLKEKFKNSPDEYNVRILGQFAALGYLMYPEFNIHTHGISLDEFPEKKIPDSYCRYVAIDPGNRWCAALFCAVPPLSEPQHVYIYDEIYLTGNATADKLAMAMKAKLEHQKIQAFIVDDHGSRRSEFGGFSIKQQMTTAFRQHKVSSTSTGHDFVLGSDDVDGRCAMVRSWLAERLEDGKPKILVVKETTPNFQTEIKYYRRKVVNKIIQDHPDPRSPWSHLMNAMEYCVHWPGLRYRKPPVVVRQRLKSALDQMIEKFERRARRVHGESNHVSLGA